MPNKKDHLLKVRVGESLNSEIIAFALSEDETKSSIVRAALREYIAKRQDERLAGLKANLERIEIEKKAAEEFSPAGSHSS